MYGTLKRPITAKEVKYLGDFFKKTHPNSKIIAIDAAVGDAGDIGLIKIANKGLPPGLGAIKICAHRRCKHNGHCCRKISLQLFLIKSYAPQPCL